MESEESDVTDVQSLNLDSFPHCDMSQSEQEITFYVSGYYANRVKGFVKCGSCMSFVLSDSVLPPVQPTHFFDIINRGVLNAKQMTLIKSCTAYRIFFMIKASSKFESFLRLPSPRDPFVSTVIEYLPEMCVCALTCSADHDVNFIWRKIVTF